MKTLYRVELTRSAKKEFDALPERIRGNVLDTIRLLAVNPFTELLNRKKLKGADNLYRVRLGDYRVVYEIRQAVLTVLVIKIGHRRDVYRKF